MEQRRLNEELEGLVSGMHTCQQALSQWRGKDAQPPQRRRRRQKGGYGRFLGGEAEADAAETAEVTGTAAMAAVLRSKATQAYQNKHEHGCKIVGNSSK